MILRAKDTVKVVDWGNGESYRFLVESDGMGFSLTHTVVRAGTKSPLEYRRHLEACYCISGSGEVVPREGDDVHRIEPGVLYALDQHDAHYLVADPESDMELICVFNPPLQGDEVHDLDRPFSHY
jgi:L-ectoine synthase